MSESCSYDCAQRRTTVLPNADISGIGVVIGYVASAGIVVLIITLSFFIAHDPTENPFKENNEEQNEEASNFSPNPVDMVVFDFIRFMHKGILKIMPGSHSGQTHSIRLRNCVLAMSDLQILTGISILISGHIQLHCGISTYHWQLVVDLAWFSSLTHLACLTFFRNYLYNSPGERIWRLVAMACLIIMLIVAELPTGTYRWTDDDDGPTPNDYAICFFHHPSVRQDPETFTSMILSVMLLALGFLVRTVKLHKCLSVSFVGTSRRFISARLRKGLVWVYTKLDLDSSMRTLVRAYVYRPLLAVFIVLRVGLDAWTSMTVEVWWLVVAFVWGVLNLVQTRRLSDDGNSDWGFGQVIPVVLVAAPLLSLVEYFCGDGRETEDSSPALEGTTPTTPSPSTPIQLEGRPQDRSASTLPGFRHLQHMIEKMVHMIEKMVGIRPSESPDLSNYPRDHPDRDYYATSPWIKRLVWVIIIDMLVCSVLMCLFSTPQPFYDNQAKKLIVWWIPTATFWVWLPINQLLWLMLCVLCSLHVDCLDHRSNPDRILAIFAVCIFPCFMAISPFLGVNSGDYRNTAGLTLVLSYGMYIYTGIWRKCLELFGRETQYSFQRQSEEDAV